MQEVLSLLTQAIEKIPSEHTVDFSRPLQLTRTNATLYLMFYQVIMPHSPSRCLLSFGQARMLATRPALLYTAKSNLHRDGPMRDCKLESLCNECIEAATRTLEILQALKRQGLLSKYMSNLEVLLVA